MRRRCSKPECTRTFEVASPAAVREHCDVHRGLVRKRKNSGPGVSMAGHRLTPVEKVFWRGSFLKRVMARRQRMTSLDDG